MPMYDSLAREIEYLILAGATHVDAPNIGSDVLDVIDAFAARFLALPNEHARHTLVLWCAHCWLTGCWEHTARLLLISPEAGCGKTRALTVIGQLVPRPDHVADLTPGALYHSIDEAMERKGGRPTVLFDEFDTVFGSAETGRIRNEEMRRLINAGHDRNEKLARKMGKHVKLFRLYTPMALAGKMSIDDVPQTIRTRSITIPMQRRRPEDTIERWNRRIHEAEAEPLRWLLRCWAELIHSYALDYVGPDRPVLPKDIEDRDADVWEPLLAVAELAGGHWPQRARVAAVAAVAADGVKTTPSPGIELLADIRTVFGRLKGEVIFTTDLLAELSSMDPRWRRLDGKRLARMLHGYGMTQTNKDQRSSARRSPRATGGSTSRTSGRATCHLRLHRLQGLHRLQTRGTTMSDLPTDIEVGDAYALRTFAVKDGRLASIAQRGGHWEDGKCEAICLAHPEDADHEVPSDDCTCGVYAFWSIEELLNQYLDFACRIVAVVRMDGLTIEGDNGVKANAAQIVAWWCAEDAAELATPCVASAPCTRRYFDRDVMLGLYPAPQKPEEPGEESQDG